MKFFVFVIFLGWCLVAPTLSKALPIREVTWVSPATVATMPRQPVRSSNIASIGYESSTYTLEVAFLSGAIYQYYGVPKSVYLGLMNASSHGYFFAANVKRKYRYKEL